MAQRIRPAHVIRALQARQKELKQELTALSVSKRSLLLRNALLACWCEALSHMQVTGGIQQPDSMACDADGGRLEQLLVTEVQLLQQLSTKEGPLVTNAVLEQLLQPDSSTIAPCTDPMAFLRYLAGQAQSQQRLLLDGQGFAAVCLRTSQAVGMKLHQLAAATPSQRHEIERLMAEAWKMHMQCTYDLVMIGKVCVVEESMMYNLETMQFEPAAAAAHQIQKYTMLVPLLQLTEQQQELIPIAMELYYDLLAEIHKERQEVHKQMTAVVEAVCADSTSAAAAAAAVFAEGGSSSSRASSAQAAHVRDPRQLLPDHRMQLQQQEALTNRLDQLLHKEYKLRLAAMSWFVGSLTYEQLSRLAVASWPYAMRLLFLATEIMQQSRARGSASPKCDGPTQHVNSDSDTKGLESSAAAAE